MRIAGKSFSGVRVAAVVFGVALSIVMIHFVSTWFSYQKAWSRSEESAKCAQLEFLIRNAARSSGSTFDSIESSIRADPCFDIEIDQSNSNASVALVSDSRPQMLILTCRANPVESVIRMSDGELLSSRSSDWKAARLLFVRFVKVR